MSTEKQTPSDPSAAGGPTTLLVRRLMDETPILDIHTHLYSEAFGPLMRYGIDELLTYHYLVAEFFRYRPEQATPAGYRAFFEMSRAARADLIWQTLFIDNTPISEASSGVITCLSQLAPDLGLDPAERDLGKIRKLLAPITPGEYLDRVFERAGVRTVIMTNDPFDAAERAVWEKAREAGGQAGASGAGRTSGTHANGASRADPRADNRFRAALRLDGLINDLDAHRGDLAEQGFALGEWLGEGRGGGGGLGSGLGEGAGDGLGVEDVATLRRFLDHWIEIMDPVYMAVSLGPEFTMDDGTRRAASRARMIREVVLPTCEARGLPLAMMIGVRRGVNPALGEAGDGVGRADVGVVAGLAREWPAVRFLVTMLALENQHELCVVARKFANVTPFGCWWFVNHPGSIREITAQRFELLGLTTIPQHSDARVLDQLLYKWSHSKDAIAPLLAERYDRLANAGRPVTEAEIRRDLELILGGGVLKEA